MNAENLTQENMEEAKVMFDEMIKSNSELTYEFFQQNKGIDPNRADRIEESIENLANEVDSLKQLLKHIFGNHILMDGKFQDFKI